MFLRGLKPHLLLWSVGRKCKVFLVALRMPGPLSPVCFLFHDVLMRLAACVCVPFCSLGSAVIRTSGLPIGGLLSRIAASGVMSWEEHIWVQGWPSNFGLPAAVPEWGSAIVAWRYVDDLVLISKLFCVSCLADMTHCMYSVPFDAAPVSRRLQWLDVVLDLDLISWKLMSKEARLFFRHLGILLSISSVLSCGISVYATHFLLLLLPSKKKTSVGSRRELEANLCFT